MSKKLLFKGGHRTGMTPYEIEDFLSLYMRDARVDEKTKAYIDSVIGNTVLNLCPYRNVLVTHKYDTVEGNVVTLDDCQDDEIIQLSEIQGNTMVNCNKDTDKELILMPNLDTNGYSNITLTEGIDGGKVDVSLEGNTMVNVCDQEDPIAITKSYTVETGNHIALQGEYDGKCRPNIYGNTLVNLWDINKLEISGDAKRVGSKITITTTANTVWSNFFSYGIEKIKPSTTYSIIVNITKNTFSDKDCVYISSNTPEGNTYNKCPFGDLSIYGSKVGVFIYTRTTPEDLTSCSRLLRSYFNNYSKTEGQQMELQILVLEGDYTNKPIPDYFTGMKSSFEDKLVPKNLYKFSSRDDFYMLSDNVTLDGEYVKMTADGTYQNVMLKPLSTIKPSTTYTIVTDVVENTLDSRLVITTNTKDAQLPSAQPILVNAGKTGIFTQLVTTGNDLSGCVRCLVNYLDIANTTGSVKYRIMVVEGDYTNYDFTNYDPTKAGKYKVDYKVTGKNKLSIKETLFLNSGEISLLSWDSNSISATTSSTGSWQYARVPLENLQPNTDYILNYDVSVNRYARVYKGVNSIDSRVDNNVVMRKFNSGDCKDLYVRFFITLDDGETGDVTYSNIQLEEGTTATTYEPYKEYTKTLYLNSPLLEGDTIEQSGNNIIHVHRYKEVVLNGTENNWVVNGTDDLTNTYKFYLGNIKNIKINQIIISDKYQCVSYLGSNDYECIMVGGSRDIHFRIDKNKLTDFSINSVKKYFANNPIIIAYELATPTQEIISTNNNLLLDSYTNGHLDVDSVIPIDKVRFKNTGGTKLKYIYPSSNYTVQFESDNVGKIDVVSLSGYVVNNIYVNKGINKIDITTKDTIPDLWLTILGIGFNMSKIVVTPKVDGEFGYFKGMKSVGECEDNKIEILSQNKNLLKLYDTKKSLSWNGITIKILNNNEILINGTTNTNYTWIELLYNFQIGTNPKTDKIIPLNKNFKYTLSANIISGTASDLSSISFAMQHKNIETAVSCNSSNNFSTTFGDSDGAYRLWVTIQKSVTFNNCIISLQLEEGETKTPYIINTHNKKEILLSEPLRGLPNGVCDKYVLIDGKWYIERNCKEITIVEDVLTTKPWGDDNKKRYVYINDILPNMKTNSYIYTNKIPYTSNYISSNYFGISSSKVIIFCFPQELETIEEKKELVKPYLQNGGLKIVYELAQPTYEPIDYNPFEVYTDITHISNNSTIPCNMVIKNSGFNCILKPNTTYTVSSNNGLSTVSTKDSIGDSILRFYNKDTSKITKMNNVLVLEGDYVTGNPPIPAFFKGMESAFEQELVTDEKDEHYGKYKVTVKAVGKNLFNKDTVIKGKYQNCNTVSGNFKISNNTDYNITELVTVKPNSQYTISGTNIKGHAYYNINKEPITTIATINNSFTTPSNAYYMIFNLRSTDDLNKVQIEEGTKATEYEPYKENNITFYINEPLRGVGNVKDKVYVKEDKVVVERNCAKFVLDGSEEYMMSNNPDTAQCKYRTRIKLNDMGLPLGNYLKFKMDNFAVTEAVGNYYGYICTYEYGCYLFVYHEINNLQQYLQQNPTTVVYQLATPTYEEVECDLSKLALEGYNHGTLFYNSNIPVTTQFYDFNVNVKDMLIPNEIYYITFIADRVKDITINLSGVQVKYKTSMGYNKVPVQLGDVVNTNFSMDSRGVELSDLMISTSTSLIYVKDMNDVCIYDEASNKYSITITSTGGNESDKRVILLDYPLLRLNKDIYDRLYYNNKDSRYRIDKKVFKHKFTNDREYSKYAAETNDTYYSSFISLNESIKDYVVITNEKVKTVKVEDDKYYFKIKWSDLGVSEKTEANGNQGMKDFFNNNEVYLYYATDGFVEIVDGLRRQTLKVYQPETIMNFLGNTTTTVTIVIPKKNI